jgi:putative phage-type endonuclease
VTRRRSRLPRAALDREAVGASQVAAVAGVDPYTTPLELWRRKLGRAQGPDPDLEPLRIGRALEGPVVDLVRPLIPAPIRRNRATFLHPDYPAVPLFATPDAFVGPDRLLEVKVVGRWAAQAWDDGVPLYVALQARAQLAVTGAQACYVAGLLGTELRLCLVEREMPLERELLAGVIAFVRDRLEPEAEPDPVNDGERWARLVDVLGSLEGEVLADAEADRLAEELMLARSAAAANNAEVAALRVRLGAWLESAGGRRVAGSTWSAGLDSRGVFSVRSKGDRS